MFRKSLFLAIWVTILSPATWAQNTVSTTRSGTDWQLRYKNYMNGPEFRDADGASINHYFRIRRVFNPEWALEGVFRADSHFGNDDPFVTNEDSFLKLMYPTIYESPSRDVQVYGDLRYHLPLSEDSRAANLNGKLETRVYATYDVGRWAFLNIFRPKYNLNTTSDGGETQYSLGNFFQVSYALSSNFRLTFAVDPGWKKKVGQETEFNNILTYPGFEVDLARNLQLNPYLEYELLDPQASSTRIGGLLNYRFL